jgi:hypothetical protein
MITLPINMQLMDWADQISMELEAQVICQKLLDPLRWQDWANQFLAMPEISKENPPDPFMFDEWNMWAERFCEVIR